MGISVRNLSQLHSSGTRCTPRRDALHVKMPRTCQSLESAAASSLLAQEQSARKPRKTMDTRFAQIEFACAMLSHPQGVILVVSCKS